jgi:hypothetical protein
LEIPQICLRSQHLEETGFGTKNEINMKKKRQLESDINEGQSKKQAATISAL